VRRPPPVHWTRAELPALRDDQRKALEAWEAAGRRGQIIMPTGTGKTVVALAAMHRAAVATLVVAPIRDLMCQWHRRIRQTLGFDAGILGDGRGIGVLQPAGDGHMRSETRHEDESIQSPTRKRGEATIKSRKIDTSKSRKKALRCLSRETAPTRPGVDGVRPRLPSATAVRGLTRPGT
jgi:hypothetical protein